jgi:hypothetical protein
VPRQAAAPLAERYGAPLRDVAAAFADPAIAAVAVSFCRCAMPFPARRESMVPAVWIEQTTYRLQVDKSATVWNGMECL